MREHGRSVLMSISPARIPPGESPLVAEFVTDAGGRLLATDDRGAALLEMTPRGARGRSLLMFFPGAHNALAAALRDAHDGVAQPPMALTFKTVNRRGRPVFVQLTRVDENRVRWAVSPAQGGAPETADEPHAEEEQAGSPELVFTTDAEGELVDLSRAAAALLGETAWSLRGRVVLAFFPDAYPLLQRALREVREEGTSGPLAVTLQPFRREPVRAELVLRASDDGLITWRVAALADPSHDGQTT